MSAVRKQISKKTRFEIFKRDGFTCQYCGSYPPKVILHVDHIHPVATGGDNGMDNLITSCEPCNLGKSARALSNIPKSLKDKALEIKERELQIIGYNKIIQERVDRIESEAWKIASVLLNVDFAESYDYQNFNSIVNFLEKLPYLQVLGAANITKSKWMADSQRSFRYFCAICWRLVRKCSDGTL